MQKLLSRKYCYILLAVLWILTPTAYALSVTSQTPAANALDQNGNTDITVVFDDAVGNASTNNFVVNGSLSGLISGSIGGSTNITFDPANDFEPGETVTVTLTTGLQGTSNVPLTAAKTSQFIVKAGGGGIFTDSGQSLGSSDSYGISLGDLDDDGDLDAVVANYGQGNKIWQNDGSGIFTDSGQSLGSSNSNDVSLGDVDGDGDLDAVITNSYQGIQIWQNDGSGIFSDKVQFGSSNNLGMSLGDVDGDGDLDVVIANNNQGNQVWLNNGSGTFNDSSQSLGSSATGGVSLGDVDNDGDLDAMFANRSEANKLWLNNGSGTFTDSGQSLGSSDSYKIALGDIDNDGDLDAVIANRNEANKVWLNDGSGIFTDSGQSLGSYESQGVLLGDMDGDGDLDIVVSNNAEANRVWLNNGSGIFADSGQNLGSSVSLGLSLGDVDNNGGLDIVVANKSEANLVWLNNATANTDPILDAIGTPKTVTVGKLLTFTVTASDADGDTLTFSLDPNNVPPGATIDPISGVFNWTPSSIGNFSTTVKVTDDAVPNQNATQTISITVVAANNAPVLNSIPTPQTVTAGSPLTFTASATDSDGDNLSFSLENAPTGATINSSSGVFSWTPSSAGSFSVTVKVTDDGVPNQNATQTISITVVAANNAPVLNSIPTPQTVTAGSPLTFTASATDSDGDNLSFSLENAPTGATINSSSGVFSWTPSSAGSFSVTVKVTDDGSPSQYDTQTVNIIVNALPINNAPVLNAITSPQTVTVGQTLTFTATATDSDGDNLSFSLENEPSGATIDASTGVFSWTPSSTGTFDFTVKVTDDGTPTNLSDQQSLSITVNPLPQVPVQQTEDPEKDKVDLTISQTDSLDPVTPESELTYSLTIINSGTALANNITVEDTLPAEVEFISATGTDWDCQQENTKVTCTLASLTGGGSSTIDIKVKVLATARGQLTNNVQVSSGNVDANPNNNNSVENTRVGDVISLITDVIPTSGGSITVDPEQKQYNLDDTITLTAIANSECYEFSHWEGACDGSGTECQLVMDETKETIAHFKPKKINLEIKAENGEVQIEPAQTEYFCDDKLKLTAIPDSNYSFTGWTGDITGKQESIPLILKEDINIEAIFALSGDLSIQPLQVYPKPEQKIQFTASSLNLSRNGGNYIWAASVGEIVASADGKTATYTVPKEEGVYYVWVSDGNSFAWSLVDSSRAKEAIVLIRMQPNTLNLAEEDIQAVSVEAVKANSQEIDVTKETQFKSENSTIAEVNQKGQVTALAVGETKILATYQNKTAEISVNVTAQNHVLQVVPDILVLYEASTESVIINSVSQSGAKTVIEDVTLTIRDSNIASVNNGIVTGLQKGSTWLDADTGKDVLQVPVVVRSSPKLNITPSYATTELGKPTYFSITGGKPPYQITASQGVIQSVREDRFIYISQVAGDAVLTVTDNLNNSSTANVHIVGELIITPKQAKLASGEVVTLRAIGGEGNYFWTATNGDLSSNTGSSVEYTAPTLAGLYTVTVRDGLENSKDILILVGADLLLSQQELFLTPTEEVEISVLGGVAPYTLEVNAGKAHLRSDVIHYTAPEVAGNYNITIRDAENNEVNAKVKVALDLLITPSSGRIDAGETLTLQAAGGFGNKRWVSLKGSLDKFEGDSVTWTAPDNFGPAFVYVIDDAGSTVAATLEVSSKGFAVTPSVRHIIPGKSDEFTAVGGASPYTWTVKQGDYQEETDSISYTAPEVRGVYKINVQDNTDKKAQAQVNVFSERIFASPKTLYITGGETLPITIGGGTGTYIIYPLLGTVKDNQLNLSGTNRSVKTTYTAPENYEGQAIIKILDNGDNLTSIEVQITAKEKTEREKVIDLYRNPDGVIDTKQMGKAIDDFFAGQAWLDRTIMFDIAEQFVGE